MLAWWFLAIALLVGLICVFRGSVMIVDGWGTFEVRTKVEIDQLSVAVTGFKVSFGMYPLDKIRLRRSRSMYDLRDAFEKESLDYLNELWPDLGEFKNLQWDGGLTPDADFWDLEGDQCLVFFLGGIPTKEGVEGFSRKRENPTFKDGDRLRFFDFDNFPLIRRTPQSPFPSYLDRYRLQPYAYFSSGKKRNGYRLEHAIAALNIAPYYEAVGQYVQPGTFQIISAGADGKFGGGGVWRASEAKAVNSETKDNQTNFHPYKLGTPGDY
jgi:hypothetical protein